MWADALLYRSLSFTQKHPGCLIKQTSQIQSIDPHEQPALQITRSLNDFFLQWDV